MRRLAGWVVSICIVVDVVTGNEIFCCIFWTNREEVLIFFVVLRRAVNGIKSKYKSYIKGIYLSATIGEDLKVSPDDSWEVLGIIGVTMCN